MPMEKIDVIRKRLESGENPKNIKLELAYEIVKMYHGEDAANKAKQSFENTFAKGGVPDDVLEIKLNSDAKDGVLVEALIKAEVVSSKADWRRLVGEGAVKIAGGAGETSDGAKIDDANFKPTNGTILKIGKRRFVKVVI